jgi:hypothetical protein
MGDFFAFRTMIAGRVIQVIFVIGLVGIVLGSIAAIANDQPIGGLLLLVFGALYWRIVCEVLIVLFRMNDSLAAIRANTTSGVVAGQAWAPDASAVAVPEPAPVAARQADERAAPAATPAAAAAEQQPAAWYDDPERPGHKRWWDGTAWGMRDDEHPGAG